MKKAIKVINGIWNRLDRGLYWTSVSNAVEDDVWYPVADFGNEIFNFNHDCFFGIIINFKRGK